MNKAAALTVAVAGIAVITVLSACSGSTGSTPAFPGASVSQGRTFPDLARSGASPKFLQSARSHAIVSRTRVKPAAGGELYVSDFGTNDVDVLKNNTWGYIAGIKNGVNGPDGNWYAHGKFYVANYAGVNIAEYADYYNIFFTYNAGMIDPVDVTVDKHGNVFEADYDYPYYNGFVNEYAQESNTVMASCAPGGGVEGVAVDKHGNVFADYNNSSLTAGYIVEYTGGLAGCHATTLPITLTFAGGMAFDKHGNLIVCDQNAPAVDVIAPPYTSITRTLGSGFSDPFHVTINKKNSRAYVADYVTGQVYVLKYPSGKTVATLGTSNGISAAWSAVDSDNFVP